MVGLITIEINLQTISKQIFNIMEPKSKNLDIYHFMEYQFRYENNNNRSKAEMYVYNMEFKCNILLTGKDLLTSPLNASHNNYKIHKNNTLQYIIKVHNVALVIATHTQAHPLDKFVQLSK